METKFQFCAVKNVLVLDGADGCVDVLNAAEFYASKIVKMVNFILRIVYPNLKK